jgi:hypothetical protein
MITPYPVQLTHNYTAFGLTIAAAFPIPELTAFSPTSSEPDITISCSDLPPISSEAIAIKKHAWTLPTQAWLDFNKGGRFWINQGKEILVDKMHGDIDIKCRMYLLGAALACALTQRGTLPLHGCSIVSSGRAILFVGRSGIGKSTLAARFQQLGYRILSDDVSAVYCKPDTPPELSAAYPQMKLGKATLEFLDIPHSTQFLADNHRQKQFFPLIQLDLKNSYPLERIYFLKQSPKTFINSIAKLDGLPQLVAHTHRKSIIQSICGVKKHFQQCSQALNNVDAFCFARPHDLQQFHKGINMLEDHLTHF